MYKYRVHYVYAPRPSVYFKKKADAIEFCKNEICQTKLYKVNIFGGEKEVEKC